jgi:sterol desaturase/sphingolipid hydroxylase (fatty acid hydroxylase superfamily)
MAPGWERWLVSNLWLFGLIIVCAHLVMSCGQTLMHCWLGHHRLGGRFFRNHIKFHHTYYARSHLTSAVYRGTDGNNTPYFLIPTILVGGALFFVLPLNLFVVMALASAASFYAHVFIDKEYHVEGSRLERFAWFRRKRQLHFAHHLHANSNFAVIDFFWDRMLGTYRKPDQDIR